jgi:hypothetical protein
LPKKEFEPRKGSAIFQGDIDMQAIPSSDPIEKKKVENQGMDVERNDQQFQGVEGMIFEKEPMVKEPLEINDKTSVDDLLEKIGKELEKDTSMYKEILKQNWVTTVKDLRDANTDSRNKWNLPTKLADVLRSKILVKPEEIKKRSFGDMTKDELPLELFNLHGNKKRKIEKTNSMVIGYSSEGIWSENFNTLREDTIKEIISS